MENKKGIYILVIVLVIIGVGWYLFSLYNSTSQPAGQTSNTQQVATQTPGTSNTPETPKAPQFIFGSVVSAGGQKIIMKVDTEQKTIITDAKTQIVKKVKINGADALQPAVFSDIKPSSNIIVSYTETSSLGYKADIIQILPQ